MISTRSILISFLSVPLISFSLYLNALVQQSPQPLQDQILSLVGRVDINTTRLQRWANHAYLNNERCVRVGESVGADACEDVKIHHASKTAFLSCGDSVERTHWYPCAGVRTVSLRAESSFREKLFKYDLGSGKTSELVIKGLDGDFITHGIDVFTLPEDSSKVFIFAVNHARDGDSIVIFSHVLGSDVVELVKNVKHPNIKTANGVVATGPLSFFITNDHYFAGGQFRELEEKFGPWSWATNVQYCDAAGETVLCKQVSGTFPGANGINLWEDRLFVGDSKNGTVTIFEIQDDKSLRYLQTVDLGAAADNINILPTTGDPIVAVFPTLEDLPAYLANVRSLGKDFLVPAAALRLRKDKGYAPELIYHDDGSHGVSFMTAVSADPGTNVLIVASVLQLGGFAVCGLEKGILV